MAQTELAMGRIAVIGGGMIATIVAAVLIAVALKWALLVPVTADIIGTTPLPSAGASQARLLSAPQPARHEEQVVQRKHLQGSGWVDEQQGIAHIPIDAAMALLITRSTDAQRPQSDADKGKR